MVSIIVVNFAMVASVVLAVRSAASPENFGSSIFRIIAFNTKLFALSLPAHHLCTMPCHAPAACSEVEPCRASIYITCPCGRIRHPIQCGRSTSNPAGREGSQQLQCSNECQVAKRNARLAEALGINPENRNDGRAQITYSDELLAFARTNSKFCLVVEKGFAE